MLFIYFFKPKRMVFLLIFRIESRREYMSISHIRIFMQKKTILLRRSLPLKYRRNVTGEISFNLAIKRIFYSSKGFISYEDNM